ncbi:hypothetical protein QFZ35_001637 [Arthrobacter ulcerisalmonis]|uniref:hypothetical protein n=1 Tax=Arthrobacter sp. B1I2 TaxID=3042263 RepID=UPI0027889351|nr:MULTISPECIES: hypothetical protein [Arthrobacter]MDQ0663139.1 hypothetical protein [Arthrobacter ulcerisalmonis]MDQ0731045.1 hypothetical protein [Arthrobacter sp. B1I2]
MMSTRFDVLYVNGHYMHCGQPMGVAGADMRSFHGSCLTNRLPEALTVYLATSVLRCACGFQMEVPDQDDLVTE